MRKYYLRTKEPSLNASINSEEGIPVVKLTDLQEQVKKLKEEVEEVIEETSKKIKTSKNSKEKLILEGIWTANTNLKQLIDKYFKEGIGNVVSD
jgi:hypothetical protein